MIMGLVAYSSNAYVIYRQNIWGQNSPPSGEKNLLSK